MSHASERDLFARSLGGDWQSRIEFYKKFIFENSRVRRLGSSYPSLDDFLQDCFTNVLRAGHTFQRATRLGERVEAVAVWTALERERLRDTNASGARTFVRMCAAVEGEEADNRAQFTSYAPPRSGPEDSLLARISIIVGEPSYQVVRALAAEKATWEDAAAGVDKPVGALGPLLVRAVDRLLRYFGAPPPLNADLEPVFADVSASDARSRRADPLKPRGRVISMHLDPAFYAVTAEMRRIGLSVPSEVRTVTLWDAARASAPPGEALRDHLDKCRYCSEVLRSLLLMQQAVLSGPNADFLFCPGASTLMRDSDSAAASFLQHLEECALCREERTRTLSAEKQSGAVATRVAKARKKPGRTIAWIAAASIILAAILAAGYYYFTPAKQIAAESQSTAGNQIATVNPIAPGSQITPEAPPVVKESAPEPGHAEINQKFAVLAEHVSLDDDRVLASVLPEDQFAFVEARKNYRIGKTLDAMLMWQQMADMHHDPGAQMLYAACLYSKSVTDGYLAVKKAEAMPPRNSFRCWSTLQSALIVGDTKTAEREVEHLSSDPEFGGRAKNILARMRAIK